LRMPLGFQPDGVVLATMDIHSPAKGVAVVYCRLIAHIREVVPNKRERYLRSVKCG
jgi:hypothetical protein